LGQEKEEEIGLIGTYMTSRTYKTNRTYRD